MFRSFGLKGKVKKTLLFSIVAPLAFIYFGCLGMEKTPSFIADTGEKVNEWGLRKETYTSLPNGSWSLSEFGPYKAEALSADVTGNGAYETLKPINQRRGAIGVVSSLQVWDSEGALLNEISSAGYLTNFRVVNIDKEPMNEIVLYSYPTRGGGGTIEIVRADGTVLHRWDNRFHKAISISLTGRVNPIFCPLRRTPS